MRKIPRRVLALAVCAAAAASVGACSLPSSFASAPLAQAQQNAGTVSRRIGEIKAINGSAITLTPDSGPDVNVTVQPTARILRTEPGEKDLKNATPIQLQDLQVGDRVLVGGKASDDGASLTASTVVAMKRSDLDAKHQQDLQDWQKRGVGGLVSAVDASAGTVTISITSFSGKKTVVIHSSPKTAIRRYAPDSVKFDDAKPGMLAEIHPGDQVRARGERNADGTELSADEIVSGAFRNVAGTVNSVDASLSTLNVQDLLSKKNVTVKVTADSQLRQLPAEMAQRIAMRLKGAAAAGIPGAGAAAASARGTGSEQSGAQGDVSRQAPSNGGANHAGMAGAGGGMSGRSGGAPDFQQMLSRMPATPLTDLHKGDAVMIVSTQGTGDAGTAIILLSGVEPILRASPSAGQTMMMTPWSFGAPAGDAGGP
jgi:hypothetical protein